MSNEQQKEAVVTGVSTGIGRAIAQSLINDGWRVFGSVRKQKDADAASAALGDAFTPLLFDVTDAAAIAEAAKQVEGALNGKTLSGLVNNAGIAVAGPLQYLPMEDLDRQLDINLYGPLRITQAFLPMLGASKAFHGAPGRIVNMSSVAGKLSSPFMGPYAISKHALEAFSDSLRRELTIHGIDVVIVGPGAVKTPIWAKADDLNIDQYKDTEYFNVLGQMKNAMQAVGEDGLEPEVIGDRVRDILNAEKPAVRHAMLKNKLMMWRIPRMLPTRMLDKALADRFGLKRRS